MLGDKQRKAAHDISKCVLSLGDLFCVISDITDFDLKHEWI
jgi:hypothetical protein